MAQLGGYRKPQRRAKLSEDISRAGIDIFIPEKYLPYRNIEVPDDIRMLTDPIMEIFPKATAQLLMSHANLKYEDIRAGNNGAFLNCNSLCIYSDPNCSYRHAKEKPTNERIKDTKIKLAYIIIKS